MATYEFRLPDIGEGLHEATVLEWYVDPDGTVTEDEPLCDVETEKAVVEIPAPCDGTVTDLRVDAGGRVEVGDVIAVFETDEVPTGETDGSEATTDPPADTPVPGANGGGQTHSATERVVAMPSTRRYARRHDVDITAIDTEHGRVTRNDVDRVRTDTGRDSSTRKAIRHPTTEVTPHSVEDPAGPTTREPLTGIRKRISERMVESKTIVPHVSSGYESDAGAFLAVKNRLDERYDTDVGHTALLMKAVVPALEAHPMMNAAVDDRADELVKKEFYNIGFATDTDDGLVVPVVDDVDEKSIVEVARTVRRHAEAAREGTLAPSALRGGTFTVSNLGGYDEYGRYGTPIINYPQVAILALGPITNRPVAINDSDIGVRKRMTTSLSFDHRVVDGTGATEFMTTLLSLLEDRDELLLTVTP
ncbi:2-oxo acid dehydrogenase subunit E2 [Halomicroarcula sp. S1AR25-4]|uniref:dihydrolipoamide acetyltransferase family protein n=1 Tax=Haloarcula sp. S1AR25-4 TaxID=2950538 RepID=UPI002876B95A|nr:dihydrolipoamide acetyltransferase family protein [Halomicroarcula sp. S1AR25-4]MDS0279704.1 2-oxo acid dehydrogenase subunit E2 [Halomicroarcula sp. S1AR25-4]